MKIFPAGICLFVIIMVVSPCGATLLDFEAPRRGQGNFSKAAFRFWMPDDAKELRGLLVLVPGLDGDGRGMAGDKRWQDLAVKWGFGIVACQMTGMSGGEAYYLAEAGTGDALLRSLKDFGEKSHHPEVSSLPFVMWGHSAGGQFNYCFACWKPDRVIAFCAIKGGFYPAKSNSKVRKVPALFFIGQDDSDIRIKNITKLFEENRSQDALWALAIEPNSGHEVGKTIELVVPFFEGAIAQRLLEAPKSAATLKPAIETAGCLGDLPTKQLLGKTAPKFRKDSVWLPNQTVGLQWQAFVNGQPLPASEALEIPATSPEPPAVSSLPAEYICVGAVEAFDPADPKQLLGKFEAGSKLVLGTVNPGSEMIPVTFQPPSGAAIHAVCKARDLGR